MNNDMNHTGFQGLVDRISATTQMLQDNARAVINRSVTARAWLTGMYIVEYEQNGHDRAKYGEQLLKKLSERLGGSSFSVSSLKDYRQFYLLYPQLAHPLVNYLIREFNGKSQSYQQFLKKSIIEKSQTVFGEFGESTAITKSQPVVGVSRDGFAQPAGCDGDGVGSRGEPVTNCNQLKKTKPDSLSELRDYRE